MEPNTFSLQLERACSRFASKTAITFCRGPKAETTMSFSRLDTDSNRFANSFKDMGIKKGDRVILFFPKSLVFVVAHLALQKIGAVSVPLNTGFKRTEMEYFIRDAEPRVVLAGIKEEGLARDAGKGVEVFVLDTELPYEADGSFLGSSAERPEPVVAPTDPSLIIYTSGTTGRPKGAVLTHANIVHDAENIIKTWEITDKDVLCHALPLFHVHGLCFALHTALLAGSHTILLDSFVPETVAAMLSGGLGSLKCSVFMAVPSMYIKLMDYAEGKGLDFAHMRLWTSGSAPLLPKDFARIKDIFGKEPVEREGMSETGMNFSNPLKGVKKAGSIGIPLPGLKVRIVNPETFEDLPPGRIGEIWLKGPGITPGYWRKPGESAKSFVEGWFRTGDLGLVDEEGYYFLTDRLKNIIISGGENISPKEVEEVINRMEGVAESSVIGIPDDKWGEKVVAAVVPKKVCCLESETVISFCKEHLHSWKCPKEVRFVEALPRNAMGKVMRKELEKSMMGMASSRSGH